MNNQHTLAPISTTQPSTVGKGRVDLVKSDFDALLVQKGYDVYLDKVVWCPCRRVADRQPLSSCRNCGGTGYVYINRYKTRMVIQSMNIDTKFKEWSEERVGQARITARDEENLTFMDRITVIGAETTTSQVLFPRVFDGEVKIKTTYSVSVVDEMYAFESNGTPLKKLYENTDYTIVDNIITLSDTYSTWEDFTISIRYRHEPSFHVIDMVRETMNTIISTSTGEKKTVMPISAVARRSHYVLDEQNYNGDLLLDNSYKHTGCGATSIETTPPPTLFRLSHPTSTSVVLNWQDPSTSETNFILERSGISGIWEQIAVINPNVSTYTDTVTASTVYFYRIATRKSEKQSVWAGPIGLTTNA